MFQTLIVALGSVVGVGVAGAANRKYYDGEIAVQQIRHFIAACLQILLVSSCLVFIFIFSIRQQFSLWIGLQTHWILWAVFVAAVSVIVQIRLGQWQVRNQARRYGVLQIAQSSCNVLLSLLLVVALSQGAEGRIAAVIGTVALFGAMSLLFLKSDNLLVFLIYRPSYLKEALAYGVPLIPHIAGIFLLSSLDRFIINRELGLAEVGVYMVAVQLAGAIGLVFDAINKAYVPWLFERLKRDQIEEKRQIVRYTYAWYAVILLGVGLFFFIGPRLVTLIAGEEYSRAGDVIGWLALGQGFIGMYLMVTNYIFYSKRTGVLSLATISTGLINVALLVLLIRTLGLKGAAIAFSIAMGIRFLLTWWVAQRRHPMPWFSFKVKL